MNTEDLIKMFEWVNMSSLFHSVAEKALYNTYYCSCVPPNNIAVVEMSLCIIDGHMCKRWMTCLHEMFVYSESRINNWPCINLIVSGQLACTRNCNKVHDLNCSISNFSSNISALSQSFLRKSTNQSYLLLLQNIHYCSNVTKTFS